MLTERKFCTSIDPGGLTISPVDVDKALAGGYAVESQGVGLLLDNIQLATVMGPYVGGGPVMLARLVLGGFYRVVLAPPARVYDQGEAAGVPEVVHIVDKVVRDLVTAAATATGEVLASEVSKPGHVIGYPTLGVAGG